MDRRLFLKSLGLGAGTAVAGALARGRPAEASEGESESAAEFWAVLVDTTKCVGCRMCERNCAKANGHEPPEEGDVFAQRRETTEKHWTVVNKFETSKGAVHVKKQCMHCSQPACATACLTQAMKKTEEGPVIWRESKCMGCRFCMVSCPFDGPKFEYGSAIPKIQKCRMCYEELQEGGKPACEAGCPMGALAFGKRSEMLDEARRRIAVEPDNYVHEVYGEHEAGWTGFLYLSKVPFKEIGFATNIGTTPYPEYTKGFLYSVPVVLTLWPAFMAGLATATKHGDDDSHGGE